MPRIDIDELPLAAMRQDGLQIYTDPQEPGLVFVAILGPSGEAAVAALDRREAFRAGLDIQEAAGAGLVPRSSAAIH